MNDSLPASLRKIDMEQSTTAGHADGVTFETRGFVGIITLDRPRALNALTQPMCLAIDRRLKLWATEEAVAAVLVRSSGPRAFCAGGDVRAVYHDGIAWKRGESDGRLAREFFADEYRMNRRIKFFPKPYVALIDGITMGGGVGLSVHGSHRVATERTLLAMPETAIGLFPDVGASYVLPRLPGNSGMNIALAGARVTATDLIDLGIATHFVPSRRLDALIDDLVAGVWQDDAGGAIGRILAAHSADPGRKGPPEQRATVDRCFAHDRIEDILVALDGDGSAFATAARAALRAVSPTSLKLTLQEMRRGRMLGFDDCLRMEYRLTQSVLAGHDFYEGIRAQLIDKDRAPVWAPASLSEVDDGAIDAFFQPPAHGDLTFDD
jgi:enoyl-CoA hydratase